MKQFFIMMAITLLAACASKTIEPAPQGEYAPAIEIKDVPAEVKIIKVPEVLPLPGQLKPLPKKEEVTDKLDPEQVVQNAHAKALWQPGEGRYLNAVQTYPYAAGALYQLYTAPGHISDIALEPGETLQAVSAGDTVRWVIGDTLSGTQVHILVKPIEAGLTSNLVIVTDRRTYHLEMKSLPTTYMAAIGWTYPHTEMQMLKQRNINAQAAKNTSVATGVDPEKLNFAYAITGDKAEWRPHRAFDDGRQVYIEFPRDIAMGEAPPLFVLGADGKSIELVNYRMRGRYYVVDRLFRAAELRLGNDPQQKVRIIRKTGRHK